MAFNSIPSSIIQVGKAITRQLWSTYVKDNLDDLNSRLQAIENTQGQLVIFDEVIINAAIFDTLTGVAVYRAPESYTLIDAKVYIFEKNSLTGTLEIDIQKSSSPDFTSSLSVFSTQPSIDYSTASDYEESSNAVFNVANNETSEGDYLRLDITSMPSSGTLGKFGVYLIAEAI